MFIKKILGIQNGLFVNSLYIFGAAIIGGFFNYVFHFFMGRHLGPADYGTLASLISLLMIIGSIAGVVGNVITKLVAQYKSKKEYGKIHSFVSRALKYASIAGVISFIIFVLLSSFIADFLNIDSIYLVLIVGLIFLVSFPNLIPGSVISGLENFKWNFIIAMFNNGLRMIFGIGLVILGFGVGGAIFSSLIATIIVFFVSIYPIRFLFKYKKDIVKREDVYKVGMPIVIAAIGIAIITTLDIILVKHFFTSVEAGLYAAMANIGKIILFVSSPIAIAVFPRVSGLSASNKSTKKILLLSVLVTLAIGLCGLVVYWFLPSFAIRLFYGSSYLSVASLLGLYGTVILLFSLSNTLMYYNIASSNFKFVYGLVAAITLEVVLISLYHTVLKEVVFSLLFVNIFLLFYTLISMRNSFSKTINYK